MDDIRLRIAAHESVLSKFENFRAIPSLGALANIAEALGVTMSEPIDGVDEKPRMVVVRKDEGRPVVRVRGAGLPVQAAGGRVQFSTTTSGMPSKSFSLLVTRATSSEIAWAAICRS